MTPSIPQIHCPKTLDEAVQVLADLGSDGSVMGGGTWIMRAQLRREPLKSAYVTLVDVPGARTVTSADGTAFIGAAVTHAELAVTDGALRSLGAIRDAARVSAHTALRNAITVAGNLRTPLPEVDIVPALLASDGAVRTIGPDGSQSIPISDFVTTRTERPSDELVAALEIPVGPRRRSAYERFTVMEGGGYGVATVAVSAEHDGSSIREARIAIGALEEIPRRAGAAETLLNEQGAGVRPEELAAAVGDEFSSRDGLDSPGWYRVAVLSTLFQRVMSRISAD